MFPIRDHNPSNRQPLITWALLVINVLVFFVTYVGADEARLIQVFYTWGIVPDQMFAFGPSWPWLTHMFLHAGWMHLIGNMLFLWIFGDNLEDQLGHFRFLLFYLAAGFAAAYAQYVPDPFGQVPMVGASGAIAGVMGGYLLLFPRARVDVLFIFVIIFKVFSLPAWVVLSVWLGAQLFSGVLGAADGEGVAYWAHFGGFVAGVVMLLPWWLKRGGPQFWRRNEGHPPHPAINYTEVRSRIPRVRR